MKKLQSFLFTLSICFSFSLVSTGCNNAVINDNTSTSDSVCSHLWSYPECNKPQTCSLCGQISSEAYGHTTVNGICQRCGKNINIWTLSPIFNPLTGTFGAQQLTTQGTGTFLNSSNILSKVTASVKVMADSITFILYEQGSFIVVAPAYSTCDISLRTTDNQIYNLAGTMYSGSMNINIAESNIQTVIAALKKTGTIRFYITISTKSSTFYEFSLETSNFAELYSEIE